MAATDISDSVKLTSPQPLFLFKAILTFVIYIPLTQLIISASATSEWFIHGKQSKPRLF